jgi:hypothetical protein
MHGLLHYHGLMSLGIRPLHIVMTGATCTQSSSPETVREFRLCCDWCIREWVDSTMVSVAANMGPWAYQALHKYHTS